MAILPTTYTPRRRRGVLEVDLGDGLIIYDRDADLLHRLNPSAALIWRMCEGNAPVDELVDILVDVLAASPQEVNSQVVDLLTELNALGLTEDASTRPVTDYGKGVTSDLTDRGALVD